MRNALKMISFVVAVILVASPCFGVDYDLKGDANIYDSVLYSLRQLEEQRVAGPSVLQRASSVCYDELGCFDKDGTFKHLKQLPEPPESVNTQFLLYTRKNPLEPQLLDYKKPESILNSNLDPKKPLKFITHGFGGKNNLTWAWQMKTAFLHMFDVNVIAVDWSLGARVPYYIQASVNTELVGAQMAVLYYVIKDKLGLLEKDLHLVGFSLGGQVVGFAGKKMKEFRGTRPGRITGLDPASPLFEGYGRDVHLSHEDADLVDVVHTNADLLIYGGVGMEKAVGHVDFYPNGGKRQPGCGSTIAGAFQDIFKGERERTCNHERAVHLFTDTILNPDGCHFMGYRCANYSQFSLAKCMTCDEGCGRMGYHVSGNGTYYLLTKEKQPFCSKMATLTVQYAKNVKKSYGSIIFRLLGANGVKENVTVADTDEKLVPGITKTVLMTLSDFMRPLKAVEALYLRYNGWLTTGAKSYGIESLLIRDFEGKEVFKTCLKEALTLNDKEYKTLDTC